MTSNTTQDNAGHPELLDDVVDTLTSDSESLEGRLTAVETAVSSSDITISDVAAHYAEALESSFGVITPDNRDDLKTMVEELDSRGHDVSWEAIADTTRFLDEKDDVYDAAYEIRHTDGLSDAEKQDQIQELITSAQDAGVDATVNGVVKHIKERRKQEANDESDGTPEDNADSTVDADSEDDTGGDVESPEEQQSESAPDNKDVDEEDDSSTADEGEADEEPIAPPAPDQTPESEDTDPDDTEQEDDPENDEGTGSSDDSDESVDEAVEQPSEENSSEGADSDESSEEGDGQADPEEPDVESTTDEDSPDDIDAEESEQQSNDNGSADEQENESNDDQPDDRIVRESGDESTDEETSSPVDEQTDEPEEDSDDSNDEDEPDDRIVREPEEDSNDEDEPEDESEQEQEQEEDGEDAESDDETETHSEEQQSDDLDDSTEQVEDESRPSNSHESQTDAGAPAEDSDSETQGEGGEVGDEDEGAANDEQNDTTGGDSDKEPPEDIFAGGDWDAPDSSPQYSAGEVNDAANNSSDGREEDAEAEAEAEAESDDPPADDPFADVSVDSPDTSRPDADSEQPESSPEPDRPRDQPSPETDSTAQAPGESSQSTPNQSRDERPPEQVAEPNTPSVEGVEDVGASLAEDTAQATGDEVDEQNESSHPAAEPDTGFDGEDAADVDDEDLVRSAPGEEHLQDGRLPQETDPTVDGLMNLPNYAQDLIDFEFVFNKDDEYMPEGVEGEGLIVTELEGDEEYVAIAHVEPRSWSIHTAEKKNQIIQTFQSSFLATLDFPVQIVSYPKKFEITDHINRLEEVLEEGRTRGGDSFLVNMGRALYPNWIESYIVENDMKQREFYLVIPLQASQIQQFEGENEGMLDQMADMPGIGPVASMFTDDDGEDVTRYQCLRELKSRLDRVASGLGRLDVDVTPIADRDETLAILYHYYNDKQPRKQAFPTGPFTVHDMDMPVGTDGMEVDDLTEVNYEPERNPTAPDMGGEGDE